ncbi:MULTISPECIES: hypothetical protein [unclassified Gordonia (in: high G+C Gram-positive bacteria)]
MMLRRVFALLLPVIALVTPSPAHAAGPVIPIPGQAAPTMSLHSAVTPRPVDGVAPFYQNRFMAPNPDASIHNDAWQTNTYHRAGPAAGLSTVRSNSLPGECASITFDRRGRILTTCIGAVRGLYLLDPNTLAEIARYPLPSNSGSLVTGAAKSGTLNGFGGGGYFYLNNRDQAVIGTSDRHLLIVGENSAGDGLVRVADIDIGVHLRPSETLTSTLPDSNGLLWFVGKENGVIGTVDAASGTLRVIRVGSGAEGEIENSFATGSDGDVYVVTNRELLRLHAAADGTPQIDWRVTYPNSRQHKPGQVDDGSGTTPALLPGGYVAIADNADPMNVVVYRTGPSASRTPLCTTPVFSRGASATENSLIAAGNSLVVENNYGYSTARTSLGGSSTPGFARVDVSESGCSVRWTNHTVAAPSVVPKLSLATGLVYTYTKNSGVMAPWSWTAIDFRTGAIVWQRPAGSGPLFNNNYAGIAIGPTGTAYLGVLEGIVSLRSPT